MKITLGRWRPPFSIHWVNRFLAFVVTPANIAGAMLAISSWMLVFKSYRVLGRFTYTRDFKKPHRKKSQGDKLGERAGYSKSPLIEMRRSDEGCDHRTSARKVGLNCKRTVLTVPRHNSDWTVSVQNFIIPPLVRYHWRSATASTDWMAGI